jgi:hypothetical protein
VAELFVIELNGTGPEGYPSDSVAEIAICRILPDYGDFDTVYQQTVYHDPLDLGKQSLEWIYEKSGMSAEEFYYGKEISEVASEVREIIRGNEAVCFDVREVFGKYLLYEPWDFTFDVTLLPSVSFRIPSSEFSDGTDINDRISSVYRRMYPNDPAGIGNGRRAMHLAQMTSMILAGLHRTGLF